MIRGHKGLLRKPGILGPAGREGLVLKLGYSLLAEALVKLAYRWERGRREVLWYTLVTKTISVYPLCALGRKVRDQFSYQVELDTCQARIKRNKQSLTKRLYCFMQECRV